MVRSQSMCGIEVCPPSARGAMTSYLYATASLSLSFGIGRLLAAPAVFSRRRPSSHGAGRLVGCFSLGAGRVLMVLMVLLRNRECHMSHVAVWLCLACGGAISLYCTLVQRYSRDRSRDAVLGAWTMLRFGAMKL